MGSLRFVLGVMLVSGVLAAGGCSSSRSLFRGAGSGATTQIAGNQAAGNQPPSFSDVAPPAADRLETPRRANTFRTEPQESADSVLSQQPDSRATHVVPATEPSAPNAWDTEDLILGPQNVVALPGAEVIVTAGVRDKSGYLRTNQLVEWSISPESVGHFAKIAWKNPRNIFVGDFVTPTIESDVKARGTTLREEQVLDRGTADTSDDIRVLKGQIWVSVSSSREGVTQVTAAAPGMADWQKHTKTMKIVWVDAEFRLPESRIIDFGGRWTMETTLRRRSDATPLSGWRVRYEILGDSNTVFPDGSRLTEVLTDASGNAKLEISQKISRQEDTLINVQIIRPAAQNTAFAQPVVVQQSQVRYRWRPAVLSLQKGMGNQAYIGATVQANVVLQNLTEQPLSQVRVMDLAVEGLKLVGAVPEGKTLADGTEWVLDKIEPQETKSITLNYQVVRPGRHTACTRAIVARPAGDLTVEACSTVSAGSETSPYTPKDGAAQLDGAQDPFAPGGATTALPAPGEEGGPAPTVSPTAPTSPTPPAPSTQPAAPTGAPATVPSAENTPFPPVNLPGKAIVLPVEDPNTLVSLHVDANASVVKGKDLSVLFEVTNRSAAPLEGYDIEIRNSTGLANASTKDKNVMLRSLQPIPVGKRLRMRGFFSTLEVGEQTISIRVSGDGKTYQRSVKILVQNEETSGNTAPASPASPATSALPASPPSEEKKPETLATDLPALTPTPIPVPTEPTNPKETTETVENLPEIPDASLPAPPAAPPATAPAAPTVAPSPAAPSAPEEVPANPVNEPEQPSISAVLEHADSERFSVELSDSPAEIKVGGILQYTLSVTNMMADEGKNVTVLFALPTDTLEIQKDAVQGPTKCKVQTANGVAEFDSVAVIKAGETVQFKVSAKTLKSGVVETMARVMETGQPPVEKKKETKIAP